MALLQVVNEFLEEKKMFPIVFLIQFEYNIALRARWTIPLF